MEHKHKKQILQRKECAAYYKAVRIYNDYTVRMNDVQAVIKMIRDNKISDKNITKAMIVYNGSYGKNLAKKCIAEARKRLQKTDTKKAFAWFNEHFITKADGNYEYRFEPSALTRLKLKQANLRDEITGKFLDETYFEKDLPQFLQHDIDALIEGEKKNSSLLDCFWCELYASINSAEINFEIAEDQANYLRIKYLGLTSDKWGNKLTI